MAPEISRAYAMWFHGLDINMVLNELFWQEEVGHNFHTTLPGVSDLLSLCMHAGDQPLTVWQRHATDGKTKKRRSVGRLLDGCEVIRADVDPTCGYLIILDSNHCLTVWDFRRCAAKLLSSLFARLNQISNTV